MPLLRSVLPVDFSAERLCSGIFLSIQEGKNMVSY